MNTNKIPVSVTRRASVGAALLSLSVIASAAIAGQSESQR